MAEKINIIYLSEVKRKKARLKRKALLKSYLASSYLKNTLVFLCMLAIVVFYNSFF
jgi:hypothetical protein